MFMQMSLNSVQSVPVYLINACLCDHCMSVFMSVHMSLHTYMPMSTQGVDQQTVTGLDDVPAAMTVLATLSASCRQYGISVVVVTFKLPYLTVRTILQQ